MVTVKHGPKSNYPVVVLRAHSLLSWGLFIGAARRCLPHLTGHFATRAPETAGGSSA